MPSPLDLWELPFLRDALLEVVLLAVAGGIVGVQVILRRLAFYAHAVGSATFPGLVTADGTGLSPTLLGLAVALGYAGGVSRAHRTGRDTGQATALLLVAALAVGVVLASDVFESGAGVDRLLFGTLLGLDGSDLALAGACAAAAAIATLALGRTGRRRVSILTRPAGSGSRWLRPTWPSARPRGRCCGRGHPRGGSAARGRGVHAPGRRGAPCHREHPGPAWPLRWGWPWPRAWAASTWPTGWTRRPGRPWPWSARLPLPCSPSPPPAPSGR